MHGSGECVDLSALERKSYIRCGRPRSFDVVALNDRSIFAAIELSVDKRSNIILNTKQYGGMIKLDVLAIGDFKRDDDGKVFDAYSSSVLIRTDDKMIVVDTSTEYMRPAIKTSFKQIGVFPKDVNILILTHSHHDHVGNNNMFQNAKILMHRDEHGNVEGATPVNGDETIAPGVRLVHTPGHTMGSMSVFVDADQKYVVAGDTIPKYGNFERMIPPAINVDAELATQSIKAIVKYADVIIPGHDPPFLVNR